VNEENIPAKPGWDECDAVARHVSDTGRETVVRCCYERHAIPGDATAQHYDPELEIEWNYAEDDVRYN
jgi:hypothetical protein